VFSPLKEIFRDIFVIYCPAEKRHTAHNLAAGGGNCKFFSGGDSPEKDAWNKHCESGAYDCLAGWLWSARLNVELKSMQFLITSWFAWVRES